MCNHSEHFAHKESVAYFRGCHYVLTHFDAIDCLFAITDSHPLLWQLHLIGDEREHHSGSLTNIGIIDK